MRRFVADLEWEVGNVTRAKILSERGAPLTLRYGDKEVHVETKAGSVYRLNGNLELQ